MQQAKPKYLSLIDDEATSCVVNGDLLGAGEWLTSRLNYPKGIDPDVVAAKILALWASPADLTFSPSGVRNLIENIQVFDRQALCTAVVGLAARRPKLLATHPELLGDIGFKFRQEIAKTFEINSSRPADLLEQCGSDEREINSRVFSTD
jgi:hypothetical protein